MRLFVGIPIPASARAALWNRWKETAKTINSEARIRAVDPSLYHITLKFIGEVPEGNVRKIASALESVEFTGYTVELAGIGGFPSPRHARVIWAGVRRGAGEIRRIHDAVDAALGKVGLREEMQEFHPHVTLARVKNGYVDVGRSDNEAIAEFTATAFALFRSVLTPEGPHYSIIKRYGVKE